MKRKILFFSFTLLSFVLKAQNLSLQWAKQISGFDGKRVGESIVDIGGNVYTVGTFSMNVDFDPGPATYNLTSNGFNDIYVSKLDSSGNFLWAIEVGSTTYDYGNSIFADASGYIYITGNFSSTVDFDPGIGTNFLTASGTSDVFILKLNSLGDFVRVKQMGGSGYTVGYDISVDALGNVYTAGTFQYTADFDPGISIYSLTAYGPGINTDTYISKLDSLGNFIWVKQMGGTNSDDCRAMVLDSNGNIYSTGYFMGISDFDPGIAVYNLNSGFVNDAFISKLDSSGKFLWAKKISSLDPDLSFTICVDILGNNYIAGYFFGTADFDPDTTVFNMTSNGAADIFILKLDSSGNFVWAKQIGDVADEVCESVAVDVFGNVYAIGQFYGSPDFDPGTSVYNLTSYGSNDIFLLKLDSSGNFIYAKQMGGISVDLGQSVTCGPFGTIYCSGSFAATADLDPSQSVYNLTSLGLDDVFIIKLSESTTGLIKSSSDSSIIYTVLNPNPFHGSITLSFQYINLGQTAFTIKNVLGQTVFEQEENAIKSNTKTIDLSFLSKGIYFVDINVGDAHTVKKIVKE